MSRWLQRSAPWIASVCALTWAVNRLPADVVTLNSGAVVHGKVLSPSGSKTVSLQTTGGALVVFNRQDVKNVTRAANAPPKSPASKAAAKFRFSPEEQAWMPKVRSLVEHLSDPDRNQSRRANNELLHIDDENAIPALARYLAASSNAEARGYFSTILRNIPGPKAAQILVQQSLFDRSPSVREAARKAIGSEKADLARPLYIEALKVRDPDLASRAAKGIAEIGDPNGETVPYLIEALVFQTVQVVATSKAIQPLDGFRLAEIIMQNQDIAQSLAAANAPPVRTNIRPGPPRGPYDAPMGMGASPLGYADITLPPTMGPINPPIFGAHTPPNKSGGAYNISTPVTLGDILNTPAQYSTGLAREKNVNSTVYDTLVQITGEKLGSNLGNWRRWWTNQQNNRALQKTKTVAPVISKSSNSSDVPRSRE